jgi:hypothetical protein
MGVRRAAAFVEQLAFVMPTARLQRRALALSKTDTKPDIGGPTRLPLAPRLAPARPLG